MTLLLKIRSFWYWLWAKHIQKTMAAILGGTYLFDEASDAYTALVTYAPELGDILGHQTYRRIKAACVVVIFARAVIRPRPPAS